MHTVTIEQIVLLGDHYSDQRPPLEQYFSPGRREQFEKDYIHYLNTLLLEMKHGNLDLDLYLVFVFTFQFIAPLLRIPVERELRQFYKVLEERYDVEELDFNLHFSTDQYEAPPEILQSPAEPDREAHEQDSGEFSEDDQEEEQAVPSGQEEEGGQRNNEEMQNGQVTVDGQGKAMINEAEALSAFQQELDATWKGRREVKESVRSRLKQDGIRSIMKWQQEKDFPELAEAFGRSVVIPSFFSFRDKKLLEFYRSTTEGITYEVAVPEGDLLQDK